MRSYHQRRNYGYTGAPEAVRKTIQNSQESIAKLSQRYNLNPKTIVEWKKRSFTKDVNMGPKQPRSTVLTKEEEGCISKTYASSSRYMPYKQQCYIFSLHRCL